MTLFQWLTIVLLLSQTILAIPVCFAGWDGTNNYTRVTQSSCSIFDESCKARAVCEAVYNQTCIHIVSPGPGGNVLCSCTRTNVGLAHCSGVWGLQAYINAGYDGSKFLVFAYNDNSGPCGNIITNYNPSLYHKIGLAITRPAGIGRGQWYYNGACPVNK